MCFLVSSCVAVLWSTVAAAQPAANAGDDQRARDVIEVGLEHYNDGLYEDALSHCELAFELSGRVELLYNVGQVHDRLGHDSEAIDALRRYLEAVPDAPRRRQIEARLSVLERRVDRDAGEGEELSGFPWGWLVVGGSVLAVGAVVLIVLLSGSSAEPTQPDVGPVIEVLR